MIYGHCLVFFHISAYDDQANCSEIPLGMESGSIPNVVLSSTGNYNSYGRWRGRLGREDRAWCGNQIYGYFQVNFQDIHQICAVATQGYEAWFIRKYVLEFSADGSTWDTYREEQDEQVCLSLLFEKLVCKLTNKCKP